jgi:hypothetical protein
VSEWVVPLSKAAAQFDTLHGEMLQAAYQGLILAGARSLQIITTEIIPKRIPQPVDRGVYRAGWKLRIGPDYVEIYNDEPVASIIEEGARAGNIKPGRAMLEALARWALRKGLAGSEREAMSTAWAIARTMQRKGIFNRDGQQGLGILRELVTWRLDNVIETEVLRMLGKL